MITRRAALLGLGLATACLDAPPTSTGQPPGNDATPGEGLLAAFRFEQAGGFLTDLSGNGHDATCAAEIECPIPTVDRFGGPGQGAVFDGTDDRLSVDILESGPFTVMTWLRLDLVPASGDSSCVVNRPFGTAGRNSWQLCIHGLSGGSVRLTFYTSEEPFDLSASDVPIEIATWHHAALVWDGSEKALWWDGELVAMGPGATRFDSNAVEIGADIDGTTWLAYFRGAIDDLEIHDRALSDEELVAAARL